MIVALMTLVAFVVLGWLALPDVPELDGERLFKVLLATLFRGEVEAAEGTVADWENKVLNWVPYHPAGRFPEEKVTRPSVHRLPGPSLEGEQALIESLAKLDSVESRLRRMYVDDPIGIEARLADPAELGDGYDPRVRLGPTLDGAIASGRWERRVEQWLLRDRELV